MVVVLAVVGALLVMWLVHDRKKAYCGCGSTAYVLVVVLAVVVVVLLMGWLSYLLW